MNSEAINLYEARKKGTFHVKNVPDVGLLKSLGLRVGSKVTVQNRYLFGGPVLLRIDGNYTIAIGKDIAQKIAVGEVSHHGRM